jgi:hypothetical protein
MATDNKSPSYRRDRERGRRWLNSSDPNAKLAKKYMREMAPGQDASVLLDDDDMIEWEDMVNEHRYDAVIAASNQEARKAVELASKSKSTMTPPLGHKHFRHVAAVPTWYHLRRIAETGDPKYWDDPVNRSREMLAHPEWAIAPPEFFRGELEAHLPKGK